MRFAERRYRCPSCSQETAAWAWDTDPMPVCACGTSYTPAIEVRGRAPGVITDSIPGGIEIRHAICHPDGTPRRFDSKRAIRDAAREAGWTLDGETPLPPRGPQADQAVSTPAPPRVDLEGVIREAIAPLPRTQE